MTDSPHLPPDSPRRWLLPARLRAGLTPAELGAPEFSPRFVRAVERGTLHPSAPAIEWFAEKLGVPPPSRLSAAPPPRGPIALLEEDLSFQIGLARRERDNGRVANSLAVLNAAESMYAARWNEFQAYARYRLYYGRAATYIRQGFPASALPDLDRAGVLTAYFHGGAQAAEQVRNARGAIFYQQELFGAALDQHLHCRRAITQGLVQDWNLKMLIYSNLANDYLALNQIDGAIATYKEALALLDEVSNQERQAAIYWGLSLAYKTQADLFRAKLYARKALDLYEAHSNPADLALMRVNMAELHIEWGECAEAEQLLDAALGFGEADGHITVLSRAYEHKAHLALYRDALDQAADWAARSVRHITAAQTGDAADSVPAHMRRTYVRAWRVAGLVAERQGDCARADTCFEQAVAVARLMGPSEAADELYTTYADLLAARGAYHQANTYYQAAAALRLRPRDLVPVA
jgi:tetratricopeptide (TPR) repeat protein